MSTDCLEASAEVVRFNRTSSSHPFVYGRHHKKAKADDGADRDTASAPVVEYVAFSGDGKVMEPAITAPKETLCAEGMFHHVMFSVLSSCP